MIVDSPCFDSSCFVNCLLMESRAQCAQTFEEKQQQLKHVTDVQTEKRSHSQQRSVYNVTLANN